MILEEGEGARGEEGEGEGEGERGGGEIASNSITEPEGEGTLVDLSLLILFCLDLRGVVGGEREDGSVLRVDDVP